MCFYVFIITIAVSYDEIKYIYMAVWIIKGLLNNMVSFILHKDFKAWQNNFVTFFCPHKSPALYEQLAEYNAGFQARPGHAEF